MSALRCSLCGISYPYRKDFKVCPIHHVETDYFNNVEPDPDWDDKAKRLYLKLVEDDRRPYPKVEGVSLVEEDGRLFVNHSDLVRAGFRPPVGGDSFKLFELDGRVYELQGWHESGRRWWVEDVAEAPEIVTPPAEAK